MTAHRPGSGRDDTLRELLTSPLEDRVRRPRRTILTVAGLVVAVAAAVAVPVLLLSGEGADTSGEAPSTTVPPTTLPGTPGYPSPRSLAPAVSAGPGRVVMVGGVEGDSRVLVGGAIGETWTYLPESNTWLLADPTANPEPRIGQAIAYDDESGVVVMFGGATGSGRFCSVVRRCATEPNADTWWFFPDTGTWSQAPGSHGPSPRFGAVAAYDAQSDRIVLFGGSRILEDSGAAELHDDTWTYDFDTDTWIEMSPEIAPAPRAYAAATYDPRLDRILLWGGSGVDAEIDGAMWAYDLESDTWSEVAATDGAPLPMWDATFVYAGVIGRSVLIGGEGPIEREIAEGVTATEIGLNDIVWVFESSTVRWAQRNPLPGPAEGHAGVAGHAAAYDPLSERIVVVAWGTTALYDPLADEWEDVTPAAEG